MRLCSFKPCAPLPSGPLNMPLIPYVQIPNVQMPALFRKRPSVPAVNMVGITDTPGHISLLISSTAVITVGVSGTLLR
jgi:hypothetical protein